MIKNNRQSFLFAFPIFLFVFTFLGGPAFAAKIQCEYIPKDSSQRILYFEGTDADHRPWTREMEDAECNARCSSESPTGLKFQCAVSGGIFGGLITQNPEGCDATYTTCGEVSTPTLAVNCKFTPKRSDGTALDGAWETLTTSESECQNLCDGAAGRGLCSSWCGTMFDALCCDETKTTCEATNLAAATPPATPFDSITPSLEIPLPTLPSFSEFTDLTLQGEAPNRYLWIPWIGQYIAAIYKYAIGIVGILAGIMIVVGGLLWLTAGGSAERVSTAKSFIESSLVGLVIALTSYMLLYVINPNLVGFESLKVKYVERIPTNEIVSNLLSTTETFTGDPESNRPAPQSFPDCPIDLSAPHVEGEGPNNPRAQEFKQKIMTVITGVTPREKVVQLAQAALKCGVTLGSCGKFSENINALAGISGRGSSLHEITGDQMKFLCKLNCGDRPSVSNICVSPREAPCLSEARSIPTAEKKKTVYDKLKNEISGSRGCATTWPDCWANDLEIGDSFVIFNANSDPPGNHTAIFLGWASEGKAYTINGAAGRVPWEHTWCIKSTCPNPYPLVRVYKAQ